MPVDQYSKYYDETGENIPVTLMQTQKINQKVAKMDLDLPDKTARKEPSEKVGSESLKHFVRESYIEPDDRKR